MNGKNTPIYIALTDNDLTEAQVEEINQLTHELGRVLEEQSDAVETVSYVGRENLPQDAKMVELIFAQQAILQILPIATPWILGKIDAIIKSFSASGKKIDAKVIIGNREVKITPATTQLELSKVKQQVKAMSEIANGGRYALVIGNSNFSDERLPDLQSSVVDAERFAEVLSDPNVGAFTNVDTLINKGSDLIEQAIEQFYKNKHREDLLVLYFSGHGIRSQNGQLFLAAQNTKIDYLRSTGLSSNFIKENMSESFSERQVLILDCCYSGAMTEGAKSEKIVGQNVNSVLAFQPSGFGRITITASDAMQYAFDGRNVEGRTENSAFTQYLIEGLRSGKADADHDGLVDVNELYQYAYRNVTPRQTPNISATSQEGRIYLAVNPDPSIRPAQLSEQLANAMHSETRLHRQGAVSELARLLKSDDPTIALAAENALRRMLVDDSKAVADSAQAALNQHLGISASLTSKPQPTPATYKPIPTDWPIQTPIAPPTTQEISRPETKSASAAVQNPAMAPVNARDEAMVPPWPMVYPNYAANRAPNPRPQNAELGGCLNVLIPGAGFAYSGHWGRAVIAFLLFFAVVFVSALILIDYYNYNSDISLFGCITTIFLGIFVYLFFAARALVVKKNKNK